MDTPGSTTTSGVMIIAVVAVLLLPISDTRADSPDSSAEEPPRPEHRFPEDVRSQLIPFSGDLEPIEADMARRLIGELCPTEPVRSGEGESAGWVCGTCPGFTSRAGESERWSLTRSVRGDFLKKGRDEIFAAYEGCEEVHAAGGGAVIFGQHKGNWEAFYRHPGLHPQQCLQLESSDHHDRLVCRVRAESDGKVRERIVDTGGGKKVRRLLGSLDNTGSCPDGRFISSYLAGWRQEDVGGDGTVELTVEKIQRWRALGDKKSVCGFTEAGGKWSRHRRLELVYEFDGESLERKEVRTEQIPATLEATGEQKEAASR